MIKDKFFFVIYTLLFSLIYLLALPFLFIFAKLKSKYKVSIPARFFLSNNPPLKKDGIWFHVCSFGEARAIYPLVEKLPKELIRLTTTTQTGYEAIHKKQVEQSRYLPFEPLLFTWLKPQKILLVMEAEFWYLLFLLAKIRRTKTVLINARMSDRSYPKYQKMAWLYRHIFSYVDEVYAQSETDKERLEFLGAKNVEVIGNIKLSEMPKATKILSKPDTLFVCGASTHAGEEALILDAFRTLKNQEVTAKLVLVPRHPERFDEVVKITSVFVKAESLTSHRYSENQTFDSDIIVVDVLGELVNIYAISDVVILGGAFAKVGGHNAAEAAQFGCKIISGKHHFNQRDIFSVIEGLKIVKEEDLRATLCQHHELRETKILQKTDINPILETIKREL
jgi:3-deoxy-D-manno-octulosonic-acid transferase